MDNGIKTIASASQSALGSNGSGCGAWYPETAESSSWSISHGFWSNWAVAFSDFPDVAVRFGECGHWEYYDAYDFQWWQQCKHGCCRHHGDADGRSEWRH